uniref:Uncharacterized protein n=1 Tax=Globodera pallida TaxID=36090 RepID=A0A183BYF6_GLOPA
MISNWPMVSLAESFVNALEPVNFIIGVRGLLHFTQPFGLENTLTGERLTFRRFIENYWLLVRCPIGREEAKWAAWENEALEWEWCREWNRIAIDFNDRDIGDGMVDEKAGPSEPKK